MQTNDKIGAFTARAIGFFIAVLLAAILGALAIGKETAARFEQDTRETVETLLPIRDVGWLITENDGLLVKLSGQAPDSQARTRVIEAIAKDINVERIIDNIQVPQIETAAPEILIEIVQNDSVSSVLGLIPRDPSPIPIYRAMAKANPGIQPLNLVQSTDVDTDARWADQVTFISTVAEKLSNVKISATPDTVKISAIVPSAEEATKLRDELTALAPDGIELVLDISAPRPLIAPFELALERKDGAFDLTNCAATSITDARQFAKAIAVDNQELIDSCQFGLGAPTDNWGLFVASAIESVRNIEDYKLRMSDNQVTFEYASDSDEGAVKKALADLRGLLPPGFGLTENSYLTTQTIAEIQADGDDLSLTMNKDENGTVTIKGVVANELGLNSLQSYGAAIFGTDEIAYDLKIVNDLDANWEANAFAGINALQALNFGTVVVKPELVTVNGEAYTMPDNANIEETLENESIDVAVNADIMTLSAPAVQAGDANTLADDVAEPSEDTLLTQATDCVEQIATVVKDEPINFEPGSAQLVDASRETIDQIATQLQQCEAAEIEIAGYTDSQGSESGNLTLSTARATAVREAIVELLPEADSRLTANGYGEADPIADNATAEGRAINRRIEFKLVNPPAEADQ